jgi:hypothetical protein
MEDAPDDLASIFFRYKPLFLAMKSVSHNKTFYNRLRKDADQLHQPLPVDYLNNITNLIKKGLFNAKKFKLVLPNYSVFRKIRLAYALQNRLSNNTKGIVYRIRNGKAWVDEYVPENKNLDALNLALGMVIESIAEDVEENVCGKTIYIPEEIHYSIPATEKQFVGYIPSNSYVSVPNNLVFGIHWFNLENEKEKYDDGRVDLDLSLVDTEKMGWDGYYRNDQNGILFSGDVTNAPLPNGATELFYVPNHLGTGVKLICVNYFNGEYNRRMNDSQSKDVSCKLIVAQDKIGYLDKDYVLDVSKILASANLKISAKQNMVGLAGNFNGENRVYFNNFSFGDTRTVSPNSTSEKIRNFFIAACENALELEYVLYLAGANIVREIPEDGEYLDLSPEALNKNTILDLLTK